MPLPSKIVDCLPPSRQPPPDYTQRSVKLKIFFYLAAIMAVLSVIERARKPDTWQWLWGRDKAAAEAPFDSRLQGATHRTAHDPVGTFIATSDSHESPEIAQSRAQVQDDTPIFRPAEREIWFHDLARVRDTDEDQLRQSALRSVAYLQLQKQPADFRGKVVTTKGTVRLAYRTPALVQEAGVKEYCVYVLQPAGQPDALIFVYALDVPSGFPRLGADSGDPRAKLREDVEVTGIFFKRCAYAAKGGTYTAPVLVAKVPQWQPPTDVATSPSVGTLELAGAALAALLLAICIAAVLWKRTGHSHRSLHQNDNREFVDLGPLELGPSTQDKLRDLERHARGEGAN